MINGNAQPDGTRFIDNVFSNIAIETVTYGSNINCSGKIQTLQADIYLPQNDSLLKRPVIIVLHGGGFKKGSRKTGAIKELCTALSLKGYVAIAADYRICTKKQKHGDLATHVINGVQDLNACIRYIKAQAENWRVDATKVFVSGASAGAIVALTKAFIKPGESALAYRIHSTQDIEGNTNDLAFDSSIAGVYSMWGAIFDLLWIQKGDVPVGCVHSIFDKVIPWDIIQPQKTPFALHGSYAIYKRAQKEGLITTLHGYDSHKHNLGLRVSPYKETTIKLMTQFLYPLVK